DLAELRSSLAVVAVRDLSGRKHQDGRRDELHQPDHAEIEGAAGQCIDLPAHGDGGNLIGKFGKGPRPEIKPERPVTEQRHGADSKTRICNRARPYCETDEMCTMCAPGGDTPAR